MADEARAIDPALLRARPRIVFVELTSRCNVRCVYCPVSLPEYAGEDLDIDVEELARMLCRSHPMEVQISGHGETTMLPSWTHVANKLLEQGLPITLTTNLAKRMSDEEIDVLTRLRTLKISVDTADADLLARLRRGVRLEIVEETMRRVIETCRDRRRDLPFLQISCTVSDVVVPGLCDLVRWSKAHGAHGIGFVNIVRHEYPPGTIAYRHPSEVDPAGALAALRASRKLAEELGLDVQMVPGLEASMEVACR
jgi:MoaA/NifB/PqqE/SkfB family radical SAM enzyme